MGIHHSSKFQVHGGQLRISSFDREDVRFMCRIISTLTHISSDGKCISFSLLHYVYNLVQRPRWIRWSEIV
jgi:hypothetical protein